MVYLDNAATTMVAPEVFDSMVPYLKEQYGNAGTIYKFGRESAVAISTAREQVARLFSCGPENIIFTSGGSEGNNTVFKGLSHRLRESGKTNIIVSAIEHDSVLKAAEALTKDGFYITYIAPEQDGSISPESIKAAITTATGLVSVMFANNETGSKNDVKAIGEICKKAGVFFHCDCVQAAGQYSLDVDKNGIDFASVSSHKIHGPKGIGALYIRDKSVIEPLICGGAEQEFGLRGGTENVASIVGFGKACELAVDGMPENVVRVSALKQEFVRTLIDNIPEGNLADAGISVNGATYLNPGKVLNLSVDGVFGESLVLGMDKYDICISAGSACRSHEAEPSHVLKAMGLSDTQARSSVRISFSRFNTEEEARQAAVIFLWVVEKLRKL